MKRTVRSLEFKREAVAMATSPGASVRGVARSLGVRPETLQYWIDHPPGEAQRVNGKRAADLARASSDGDDPAALKLRLKEAEARIRRLEMERDILKKATAFFANQSP
jgi:transposase